LWRASLATLLLIAAAASGVSYAYSQIDQFDRYITAPIERGRMAAVVRASGTVHPISTVDVNSQLSGRVAEVFVSLNDTVTAGQALGRLDPEIFAARVQEARASLKIAKAGVQMQRAAVERAKAALAAAQTARAMAEENLIGLKAKLEETERQLQKMLDLPRTDTVSRVDLSKTQAHRDAEAAEVRAMAEQVRVRRDAIVMAEAEVHMAEANLENAEAVVEAKQGAIERAELDLARTELRAPIDGVIIKRDIGPGQTVGLEEKTLFKIAGDLRAMAIHGKIDEADVGRVKRGQTVSFTVDAYPNRGFTGRVVQVRVSPEMVQNPVTYTVVISAPNPDQLLLPGMTASFRIVIDESANVLKIPNQALRFRPRDLRAETSAGSSATVWVIGNDGRPSPVPVILGQSENNGTELRSGALSEGQAVIVGTASAGLLAGPLGIRWRF
jgi:HlyD family secretion protein